MINLPTELLRTFVAVVDCSTMLKASERINVTPSAISLQIKRLEEIVGTPLFFRDARRLTLTPAGQTLLDYSRTILASNDEAVETLLGERSTGTISLGVVEDFARTLLGGTLRLFAAMNPESRLSLRICGSRELRELLQANRLDLAVVITDPDDPQGAARRRVSWYGDQSLVERDVLPLVLLEAPCMFREMGLAALDRAGVAYDIVVETTSASVLHAAIEAGLGVAPRTATFMADRPVERVSGLPELGEVGYAVIDNPLAARGTGRLRQLLGKVLSQM
ncbi:MAG TPA: LysR family transcriptional regulator [Novosphingobium sp.]